LASPKKQNGYTYIPDGILDRAVKINLSGTQFRILSILWRYFYAADTEFYFLSESFIAKEIYEPVDGVAVAINGLSQANIIFFSDNGTNHLREISFNESHDTWIDPLPTIDNRGGSN